VAGGRGGPRRGRPALKGHGELSIWNPKRDTISLVPPVLPRDSAHETAAQPSPRRRPPLTEGARGTERGGGGAERGGDGGGRPGNIRGKKNTIGEGAGGRAEGREPRVGKPRVPGSRRRGGSCGTTLVTRFTRSANN